MGHNGSRYAAKRLGLQEQLLVDEYKAQSVWGKWWQLDPEFKRRYFSADEMRWIRRYGARIDELANHVSTARSEKERHFVDVCSGTATPNTDKERLWLRVQMVCRHEESIIKAALCDQAMETAAGLAAEAKHLRYELRDAESVAMERLEQLRLLQGDEDAVWRHSLCNVMYATPLFTGAAVVGPPTVRMMFRRGAPSVVYAANAAPASQ